MSDKPKTIDLFCPFCNVYVEAKVVADYSYETSVIYEDMYAPDNRQYIEAVFTFAACLRCKKPLLARQDFQFFEGMGHPTGEVERVYPTGETIPRSVPEIVARPFRDAHKAYKIKLYDACAVMCRKCVEAVCRQYGESRGNLAHRLDRLLQKGVIDTALFEWTKRA